MHPVIMRQFAAEHIRKKHAKAEDERLARPPAGAAHALSDATAALRFAARTGPGHSR